MIIFYLLYIEVLQSKIVPKNDSKIEFLHLSPRRKAMRTNKKSNPNTKDISRRNFIRVGGSLVAGGTIGLSTHSAVYASKAEDEQTPKIKDFRVLGRTGFKVSDICMGGTRVTEANVVRYAYDHGVNYFDTAEGYSNGTAERCIGESMQYMDRDKIFITTKLHIRDDESEDSILDRFNKCQERLNTKYVDCLYMHNPGSEKILNHAGFHSATKKLKGEGRLRFIGLSSHGPRGNSGETMESILTAAAEDGRFDVMLMIYNFLNYEKAEKILAACKKNNMGTTAMKISPKIVKIDGYDAENPTREQTRRIERMIQRGRSKSEAEERLVEWMNGQKETIDKYKPFYEKYNVKTDDDLSRATVQWALQNPDMHTVCLSFSDFDLIDKVIPLSGTKLSKATGQILNKYGEMIDKFYCRHGCNSCLPACPYDIQVSSIMRYTNYSLQGREKYAMQKYSDLNEKNASICHTCDAPCLRACPHNVNVQANLIHAHSTLTLV